MIDPEDDDALASWFGRLAQWDATQEGPCLEEVLTYGDHPEQVIDRWGSTPVVNGAAVITLHGGYFLEPFGRDLQNCFVRACASAGFPVYNVEYRRDGCGGDLETTTLDVRRAVDFLAEHFGITRFAVIGHSAGGYLAQTLADHPAVHLVVALGSVCDLAATVRSGLDEGAVASWLGAHPDDARLLYQSSDLMRRHPFCARQVLVHGVEDRVVDVSQSRNFAARALAKGADVELVELKAQGHFCFLDPREAAFEEALTPVREWWARLSVPDGSGKPV
jgi:acetyl esterase/lipase